MVSLIMKWMKIVKNSLKKFSKDFLKLLLKFMGFQRLALMQLLKSIYTYKGCPITVYRDGEEDKTYNAFLAAACNGQQFGGGVRICPAANVDDGKIHVVIVDVIEKKWTLTKTLVKLLRGKILDHPRCTHYLCEKVRFVPNEPCTYQLDGELYQSEDIEIQVCQGLRMYR